MTLITKSKTMKKISWIGIFLSFTALRILGQTAQDSTGYDGDNLNLQGVLETFKASADLQAFEKALNSSPEGVNNLDLNGDGKVDFIQVNDQIDGESRLIILSVDVSEKETQDIAAIAIERVSESDIKLQIIGDEEIYGQQMIVEPTDEIISGAKGGPAIMEHTRVIRCNVCYWPCVRYVYGPRNGPYASLYRWGYYPGWWEPWYWSPWHNYHQRWSVWNPRLYRSVSVISCSHAHGIWRHHHRSSPIVHVRYKKIHENRKSMDKTKSRDRHVEKERGAKVDKQQPHQDPKGGNQPSNGGRKPRPTKEVKPNVGKKSPTPKATGKGAKPAVKPAAGGKRK